MTKLERPVPKRYWRITCKTGRAEVQVITEMSPVEWVVKNLVEPHTTVKCERVSEAVFLVSKGLVTP